MSNEPFDTERATALRAQMTGRFRHSARRKTMVFLIIAIPFIVISNYASIEFFNSRQLEHQLLHGLLYLLCINTLIGIGLAAAVHYRYLLQLKELKQLRIDLLTAVGQSPEEATGGMESLTGLDITGFSVKKAFMVVILISVLISVAMVLLVPLHQDTMSEVRLFYTVHADGSAHAIGYYKGIQAATMPMESFSSMATQLSKNVSCWDGYQRKLAYSSEQTAPDQWKTTITFPEPILPNESMILKLTADLDVIAKKEGDVWTIEDSTGSLGREWSRYETTFELPAGAIIKEGKFDYVCSTDKSVVVRLKGMEYGAKPFHYRLQYTLPNEK